MTFDISTKIPHSSVVAFDFSDFEPITMLMLANKAGGIDKTPYFPGFLTLWQLPVCHAFYFSVVITFCLVTSSFQVEISRYCKSHAPKLGISLWITIKNDSHDAPASFVFRLPKRRCWQSQRSRVEGCVRSWASRRIFVVFCVFLVEKDVKG